MHLGPHRARVANAAHAAETACREAELGKGLRQAGALEHELGRVRTRSHHALHPRLGKQAALAGMLGNQAACEHHGGVGCGRAARDRSNRDSPMSQFVFAAHEIHRNALVHIEIAVGANRIEARAGIAAGKAVMRTARARERALDFAQIQLEHLGVHARCAIVPHALGLRICLNERNLFLIAARKQQIFKRAIVDREQRARAAVFGSHVRDAGALRRRKRSHAIAEAFDELAHHALRTQHLCECERGVHGRYAITQLARQMNAHDLRHERRDGLAERRSFSFDAAHAPGKHANAICRGGMRVGTHNGIEVGELAGVGRLRHNAARKTLDVDLMADTRSRRNNANVLERRLRPLQKAIAFAVALEFHIHVLLKSIGAASRIGNNRMVDHQIERDLRINARGIGAQIARSFAHHGQVNEHRHASEILQQNASRHVFNFAALNALRAGVDNALRIEIAGIGVVDIAQHVFEQNTQRMRQRFGPFDMRRAAYLEIVIPHVQGLRLNAH